VRNDESLLKKKFRVHSYFFDQKKLKLPFSFVFQFFFLLFKGWRSDIFVSWFAGYSSFLPSIFSKLFNKPHLIILGGTDCYSFPSIRYGNFQKRLHGWFTCQSLKMATHLSPVAEELVDAPYTYTDDDFPRQGYKNFCRSAKAPYTTLNLGYDPVKFFKSQPKVPSTFLTVAQMNKPNFYRKGIDLIFEMAKEFPQYSFTIVGNTDEMKYDLVPQNIKLLPFVKYESLRDIYSEHEFYFQLSITEGFPSAPCEAMLCECIPITSNVGALPAIVDDTGFILNKKDLAELKSLIKRALNDNRKKLGSESRNRIVHKFPLAEREKLIALIEILINNSK